MDCLDIVVLKEVPLMYTLKVEYDSVTLSLGQPEAGNYAKPISCIRERRNRVALQQRHNNIWTIY